MTSNTSSAGKTAMEEVLELFPMTVEINKNLDFSVMIDVLQDTRDLVWTVIRLALQNLEMMASTAEKLNMVEELVILGSSGIH